MSRPFTCAKRVWCSEQHFLARSISKLMSISLRLNYAYLHGVSDHILNQIGGSESLSHSLYLAVPIEFPAIPRFCKRSCVVVHMHQALETWVLDLKKTQLRHSLWCPLWQEMSLRTLDPLSASQSGSGNKTKYCIPVAHILLHFNATHSTAFT